MTAVADLYRALVLEHGKRPRNRGRLAAATHAADGDNPLCGDALHVDVTVCDDVVQALRFEGESCLLATASASVMTERLAGVTVAAARGAVAAMEAVCGHGTAAGDGEATVLGDVAAFADVHRHPVRVGCALLAWRTLRHALGD